MWCLLRRRLSAQRKEVLVTPTGSGGCWCLVCVYVPAVFRFFESKLSLSS